VSDELRPHMGDLLKRRRSGVVAALLAATGRFCSPQQQAALLDALATALGALPQWAGRQGVFCKTMCYVCVCVPPYSLVSRLPSLHHRLSPW
jgi:hypothetical protein